jgi:hypothetical protein
MINLSGQNLEIKLDCNLSIKNIKKEFYDFICPPGKVKYLVMLLAFTIICIGGAMK